MQASIYILTLVGIFFSALSKIQAQDLDSLYRMYEVERKSAGNFTVKQAELLQEIINKEQYISANTALAQCDSLVLIWEALGNEKEVNRARYYQKGCIYEAQNDVDKALFYYMKYAAFFSGRTNDDAYYLLNIGNLLYAIELYDLANMYYEKSEHIFEEINFPKGLGTIYGNYSLVAFAKKDRAEAFLQIQKALNLQINDVKDEYQIAHSMYTLGKYYRVFDQNIDSAQHYQRAALRYLGKGFEANKKEYEQFTNWLALVELEIAQNYVLAQQKDSSLYHTNRALVWAQNIKQPNNQIKTQIRAAEVWIAWRMYKQADSLLGSLEDKVLKDKQHQKIFLQTQISLAEAQGAYQKALHYYKAYQNYEKDLSIKKDNLFVLNDQVLQIERNTLIAKQAQVIEAEKQVRFILFLILGLIASTLFLVTFFLRKLKQKNVLISQQAATLALADRNKERILLILGHDLRGLFNVLLGNAHSLDAELQKSQNGQARAQVQNIELAAKKAFHMMDNLMQWASLERGPKLEIENQIFQLNHICQQVNQQLNPISQQNQVEIEIQAPDFQLDTDPNLFSVILRNLLSNALKHSPKNGKILVYTSQVEGKTFLHVQDQGPGLPAHRLKKLFQKHDSLQVAKQGSGLGLEIIRDLSMLLQIPISVENIEPQGAKFSLQLPNSIPLPKIELAPTLASIENENENKFIKELAEKLQPYQVFQGQHIRRILQQQMPNPNEQPKAYAYLQQIKKAVAENNPEDFKKIIQVGLDI